MSFRTRAIDSRHNASFKKWKQFISFPEMSRCPWLPFEGWKTVSDLCVAGRSLELLLLCDDRDPRSRLLVEAAKETVKIPQRLFDLLSAHQSPQGVIGFFNKPNWNRRDLTPFILYLHSLQDPGNLGTLLRTAAATGIFSVVTSRGTVSCFNNKVVRASTGSLYSVPFLEGVDLHELVSRGYSIWVALPGAGQSLFEANLQPPLALVVGSEGSGLESLTLEAGTKPVQIPMHSSVDSLNAAVAGSLMMYEAFRKQVSQVTT